MRSMMHQIPLLAFISYVSASTCPDATPVYDFNFSSYGQGIWYEYARYPYPLLDANNHCGTNEYNFYGNFTTLKTTYVLNNKKFVMDCIITLIPDADKAGKMIFKVVSVQGVSTNNDENANGFDTVLAVDYDNYIIIRPCQYNEATKKHEGYGWILSRSKHPSEEIRAEIENFVKNSPVLDSSKFIYTRYDDDLCRIDP